MLSRIREYVEKYEMIEQGDRILAGISGGADSVCLLFVLLSLQGELGFSLEAVHVNHGLRGEEALGDQEFVRELCKSCNVPLTIRSCRVQERAAREGLSLEEAGRICRYEIFYREAERLGCNKIAVAHHRDDQAETVLFRLFRGTGLKGLGGMEPRAGAVIRPLLETGREEIEGWLRERGLSWRQDSTNQEETYTRNYIRHTILGGVRKHINPQAAEVMCRTAEELRETEEYLEKETQAACRLCVLREEGGCLILAKAYGEQPALIRRRILRRCFEASGGLKDVGRIHIQLLDGLFEKQTGSSLDLPGGRRALRVYQGVRLLRGEAGEEMKEEPEAFVPEIPGTCRIGGQIWEFSLENMEKLQIIPEKTYTKWFDYDKIVKYLEIRRRRPGDYLEINREHGRKKLKQYLIDQKVPAGERDALRVLADGSHVLWVPGKRISEGYKVTEHTKRILKVQVSGGSENG